MHDHLDPEKGEESGVQGVFINNNKLLVWAEHLPHRVAESVNPDSFKINKCVASNADFKSSGLCTAKHLPIRAGLGGIHQPVEHQSNLTFFTELSANKHTKYRAEHLLPMVVGLGDPVQVRKTKTKKYIFAKQTSNQADPMNKESQYTARINNPYFRKIEVLHYSNGLRLADLWAREWCCQCILTMARKAL